MYSSVELKLCSFESWALFTRCLIVDSMARTVLMSFVSISRKGRQTNRPSQILNHLTEAVQVIDGLQHVASSGTEFGQFHKRVFLSQLVLVLGQVGRYEGRSQVKISP